MNEAEADWEREGAAVQVVVMALAGLAAGGEGEGAAMLYSAEKAAMAEEVALDGACSVHWKS